MILVARCRHLTTVVVVSTILGASLGGCGNATASTETNASPSSAKRIPSLAKGSVPPPFEAVTLRKVRLPARVKNASQPAFTNDGKHLLFYANVFKGTGEHLWIVGLNGKGAKCLSCGLDVPSLLGLGKPDRAEYEQPGLITPFPDGKRIFFGPYGDPRVLKCTPSVLDCQQKKVFDIDLSGALPGKKGIVPPSGVVGQPQIQSPGAASPKLSPDGKYIAFSVAGTGVVEKMIIARLVLDGNHYVLKDPRVLNPPGPNSPSDTDVDAWSQSTSLFEFKTFADGGAAVTYVQVGGADGLNPDVWKLNLKTGRRTRLSYSPDWDEDMAISPDGKSMLLGSSRGLHNFDYLGIFPYRTFFATPLIAGLAINYVAGAHDRVCVPFAPRLLPSSGDKTESGAILMGQNLMPYDGSDIRYSLNINGWPMWSPDGTMIALSTQSFTTLAGAPYLVVADLPRKPTKPRPVVSSQPGNWAPTPAEYHGALAATTTVTLSGKASGTVTVKYDNPLGIIKSMASANYHNYSDDGKNFINGTVELKNPKFGSVPTEEIFNLTLSGVNHGYMKGKLSVTPAYNSDPKGQIKVSYDGTTFEGLPTYAKRCSTIKQRLRGPVKLDVQVSHDAYVYTFRVTAAYHGSDANEQGVDRRPVRAATVKIGNQTAQTNAKGIAIISLTKANKPQIAIITAGDSFVPARIDL